MDVLPLFSNFAMGCKQTFFGLPPWNKYLEVNPASCSIVNFEIADVWLIAAALLEILTRAGGLIAVIFVIWGGFRYLTSQGNPEHTTSARRTIIYALVGLATAIVASTTVSFILSQFLGAIDPETGLPITEPTNQIQRILNLAYGVAGGVSALLVVIGAFKYVSSAGDPQKTSGALNTIIYALVGLVVVVFATVLTGAIIGRF